MCISCLINFIFKRTHKVYKFSTMFIHFRCANNTHTHTINIYVLYFLHIRWHTKYVSPHTHTQKKHIPMIETIEMDKWKIHPSELQPAAGRMHFNSINKFTQPAAGRCCCCPLPTDFCWCCECFECGGFFFLGCALFRIISALVVGIIPKHHQRGTCIWHIYIYGINPIWARISCAIYSQVYILYIYS